MFANSLSPAKPASIFDLTLAPQAGGEGTATIDFSTLLPSLGEAVAEPEEAESAAVAPEPGTTGVPENPILPGIQATLPVLAESGKILPLVAAALPSADAPVVETTDDTVAAAVVPIIPGQLPAAATRQAAEAPATQAARRKQAASADSRPATAETAAAPTATKPAKSTAPLAVAVQVAPAPERAATTEAAPAAKSADVAVRANPFAPSADRGGERGTPGEERPATGRMAIKAAADLPRFHAAIDAMPAPTLAIAAEPALEGTQPLATLRTSIEAPAMRELTRIVETLASAREALGAGSATLALDHAEFGALSLRFDQRTDGLLSVQLSAADPEAHQAVTAAVAAAPADAGGSSPQPHTQSQNGNAASRGSAAERESQSANAETQRDQREERQRNGARGEEPGQRGQRRSGIYA